MPVTDKFDIAKVVTLESIKTGAVLNNKLVDEDHVAYAEQVIDLFSKILQDILPH